MSNKLQELWTPDAARSPAPKTGSGDAQSSTTIQPAWNVLVLEDEPLMSALIGRYLSTLPPAGFEGLVPGYLSSGFDLLTTELSNIRVAVVDILLPQVTGVDLVRDFRRRYPKMGIVPVTGMATEPMRRQLRDVLRPAERILDKPLRREDFLDLFARAWTDWSSIDATTLQRLQPQPPSTDRPPTMEGGDELWTLAKHDSAIRVESRRKLPRRRAA